MTILIRRRWRRSRQIKPFRSWAGQNTDKASRRHKWRMGRWAASGRKELLQWSWLYIRLGNQCHTLWRSKKISWGCQRSCYWRRRSGWMDYRKHRKAQLWNPSRTGHQSSSANNLKHLKSPFISETSTIQSKASNRVPFFVPQYPCHFRKSP